MAEVYASTANDKYLGTFSITAHLKEAVNPQVLQQALNDLVKRQPYISGRLRNFKYELLAEPSRIAPEAEQPLFSAYYNEGDGHILRVLYGERYFKVETSHHMTDGRGLSKITSALLVRYFELLGVEMDKGDIMDCADSPMPEETEDAYARYASPEKPQPNKDGLKGKAYKHNHFASAPTRVAVRTFDLAKIKASAKAHDITVGTYIAARILSAIAKERDASGSKAQIVINFPVDFRSFFPSKTIRNFVNSKNIVMPEGVEFSAMAQQVQQQLATVDAKFAQTAVDEANIALKALNRMPRWLERFMLGMVTRTMFKKVTTMLSNLGLVRLPKQVEERIENLEFVISPTPSLPYTFACIAVGNALTLSITADIEGDALIEKIFAELEQN